MKKIMSIIMAAAVVTSLAGCSTGSTTAETTATETSAAETTAAEATAAETTAASGTKKTTFTVGFDQDFPPMGFVGDNGEYTGFDLDVAKAVAEKLGLEFVPQPIAWDAKDMELSSGTIDCVWNGFTINGRENEYTWSEPYMDNTQIFVVAKDSGITDLAGLAGKVVTVQTDSSAEAALKDMPDLTATFGAYQTTADYNTAFMDLEMGAVDAVAMDIIVAGYQLESRGDDKFEMLVDYPIANEEYGVGFKLGNTELRDQVQSALEEMAADGTLASISETWFGTDVTTIGK